MDNKYANMLDRMTNTVMQQVETMKGMVNSSSDYALTPEFRATKLDLAGLVHDVVDLYSNPDQGNKIDIQITLVYRQS